jgi:hypothetical protein
MDDLKNYISEKRPNLSKTSLNTYNSILRSLYKKVFKSTDIDISKYSETEPILEFLKDMEPNKRKTILASLVVISDKKEYRDLMLEDIKDYNKEIAKQEKTKAQSENWIEKDDVEKIISDYEKNAKLIYKKKKLSSKDYQDIQDYIILCLLGGKYIPPRRAMDYTEFKTKNINKTTDNYKTTKNFIFNKYKTAKTYGQQTVLIPQPLKLILNKWYRINPTDYLLFDTSFNKLSNVKLNQRLNKIFGRKISVNQMRHTYLTDKYLDHTEKQKELENDLSSMGTSVLQVPTYVKQ